MLGRFLVFLGKNITKQLIKCHAQGHITVTLVRVLNYHPFEPQYNVLQTEPLHSLRPFVNMTSCMRRGLPFETQEPPTKQLIKCHAQGHITVTLVRVLNYHPFEPQYNVLQTEPLRSLRPFVNMTSCMRRGLPFETQEPPNGYHEKTETD